MIVRDATFRGVAPPSGRSVTAIAYYGRSARRRPARTFVYPLAGLLVIKERSEDTVPAKGLPRQEPVTPLKCMGQQRPPFKVNWQGGAHRGLEGRWQMSDVDPCSLHMGMRVSLCLLLASAFPVIG